MRFREVTVISDRVYNGVAVEKKRNSPEREREREDISLYVLAHASLILGNRLNYSRVRNRIMGRARIWPSHVRLTSVSSPNRFIVRRKVPSILTDSIYSRDTLSPHLAHSPTEVLSTLGTCVLHLQWRKSDVAPTCGH